MAWIMARNIEIFPMSGFWVSELEDGRDLFFQTMPLALGWWEKSIPAYVIQASQAGNVPRNNRLSSVKCGRGCCAVLQASSVVIHKV